MDQSRPKNGLRLAGVAFVCALALTACGGGGSPSPGNGDAQPSNTGTGTGSGSADSGTGSATSGSDAPSSNQSVFAVAETSQTHNAVTNRQLVVVDTRNHTAVLTLGLPAGAASYSDWYVTDRYSAAPGDVSAHIDGASQLYVIQNGHVIQIDLSGTTLGASKTISSVSNACGIASADTIDLDLDGKHSWVPITTAGLDGKCDQTADNDVVLVSSNMDTSQPGVPGGQNGLALIESIQDSLASPATGILALDRRTTTLGVYTTDLKSRLYTVPITDHALSASERVQTIAHLPQPPNHALIQLGASLYVSGTSNGQMVLGQPILQLAVPNSEPTFTSDSNNVYLPNGTQLVAISPAGTVTKLADLSATAGRVAYLMATQSSVLVQQTQDTPPAGGSMTSTLTSFSKASGAPVVLAQGVSSYDVQMVGVTADTVFYKQATPNSETLSDILQVPARGGTASTIVSGIYLAAETWSPQIRLTGVDVTQLIWCQPVAGAQDCSNAPMISYNLSSGQKITLGTVPLDTGWSNVAAMPAGESFASRTDLMGVMRLLAGTSSYQQDLTLWTYNADVANSLTRVVSP